MIRPVLNARLVPYLASSSALRPELTPDIAIDDCAVLLDAVMARLRRAMGERADPTPEAPAHGLASAAVTSSMRECVDALDTLHATLTHELGRRQRLEMELLEAKTALARARAELALARAAVRPAIRWSNSAPTCDAG